MSNIRYDVQSAIRNYVANVNESEANCNISNSDASYEFKQEVHRWADGIINNMRDYISQLQNAYYSLQNNINDYQNQIYQQQNEKYRIQGLNANPWEKSNAISQIENNIRQLNSWIDDAQGDMYEINSGIGTIENLINRAHSIRSRFY